MTNSTQIYSKDSKWRIVIIRSLVFELLLYGNIQSSLTRDKEVKRHAEKLITKAKAQSLASRRHAASFLRPFVTKDNKTLLQDLFDTIAPKYKDRPGGYTRIYK
ncbi:50S ribosomal protein L17, partial [Mycoplasmopsis synoviae]